MAVVELLSEGTNTRRDLFEERSLPGQASPMFLGSKYGGETLRLVFSIQGVGATRAIKHSDAVDYIKNPLTGLKALIQSNEEITVSPIGDIVCQGVDITIKIDTMTFDIQPKNTKQIVQITGRAGYL